MLALTKEAAAAVETIVGQPDLPADAVMRITSGAAETNRTGRDDPERRWEPSRGRRRRGAADGGRASDDPIPRRQGPRRRARRGRRRSSSSTSSPRTACPRKGSTARTPGRSHRIWRWGRCPMASQLTPSIESTSPRPSVRSRSPSRCSAGSVHVRGNGCEFELRTPTTHRCRLDPRELDALERDEDATEVAELRAPGFLPTAAAPWNLPAAASS